MQSYVVAGARRTRESDTHTEEYYPPPYGTDGTLVGNLRFALRHEALDLGVVHKALQAIVDMPNKRAGLLVRMFLQNAGRLSRNKRKQFDELKDEEIRRMEAAIQEIIRSSAGAGMAIEDE